MAAAGRTVRVEVEGRTLTLSNLDKQLFPSGFTKADYIRYATDVAAAWLPHLAGRALTMKRYPDGSTGPSFYEKRAPSHAPGWVATVPVWLTTGGSRWGAETSAPSRREEVPMVVVDGLPTLVWLANLAALELHVPMGRAAGPGGQTEPSMVVFDLDPGAPAGFRECAVVACRVREVLDALGLQSVVKSSGSKGLQVYVPVNTPGVTYDDTRPFARAIAQLLEKEDPRLVVSVQRKDLRGGKVLVDWYQNEPGKTTVAAYSLRAKDRPYVSAPLTWDEVADLAERGDERIALLEPPAVVGRVREQGDHFAAALSVSQALPSVGR